MAENRFIGDYPVIGIRPCIDGRRGPLKVRESLEEQTMNMAKAAQKLLTENLKYSNGEPVKVIISSTKEVHHTAWVCGGASIREAVSFAS